MNNFELNIPNNVFYEVVEWIDGTKEYFVFSNEDGEKVAKLNNLVSSEIGTYLTGPDYEIDFTCYNKTGKYKDDSLLRALQPYSKNDEELNWNQDMADSVWFRYNVGVSEELIVDDLDESVDISENAADSLNESGYEYGDYIINYSPSYDWVIIDPDIDEVIGGGFSTDREAEEYIENNL